MVQQSYPRHPPFHRAIRREIAVPSFVLMGDGARKLPPWGLYAREGRVDERSEIYPA